MNTHPSARFLDGRPKQNFIGGIWQDAGSGDLLDCVNPATGQVIGRIAASGAVDVDRAVAAARAAFAGEWSRLKPYDRQKLLLRIADLVERHYDELSTLDTLDMGAPVNRTRSQGPRAVAMLRFYAGCATLLHGDTIGNSLPGDIQSYTLREPVGVVGAIIPWNAPVISAIWKLGPVLATGCTAVLKPAEEASLSCLRLVELMQEAGVPDGVVNIVTGRGEEAGAALAAHPGVDKVAFTGSTETGRRIIEASAGNIKRLSLELGGKSPNIVFADADLDAAAQGAATAIFANSGQICSAGSRLYVENGIYDAFVERVAALAGKLRIGDGLSEETDIGPLVSAQQLERVCGYLDSGKSQGALVRTGGRRIDEGALAQGYFVAPTVFAEASPAMRIVREEIFGPVVSCIRFTDIGEVLQAANDTPYGLGSGVWSNNINTVQTMIRGIRAGTVWVNGYQMSDPAVPFGGFKQSGYGRESGLAHFDEYLSTKAVWIRTLASA